MAEQFRQTFGKHNSIFSQTPLKTLNSKSSSKYNSSANSPSESDWRSHVMESYSFQPSLEISTPLHEDGGRKLCKQARSSSLLGKLVERKENMECREIEMEMKANIKNVDGMNERMVNLIKEFKNEQENSCSYFNRSLPKGNKKDEHKRQYTENSGSTTHKLSRFEPFKSNKKARQKSSHHHVQTECSGSKIKYENRSEAKNKKSKQIGDQYELDLKSEVESTTLYNGFDKTLEYTDEVSFKETDYEKSNFIPEVKKKCYDCGLNKNKFYDVFANQRLIENESQIHNGFERKIKNISDKIESYQKKVSNYDFNKIFKREKEIKVSPVVDKEEIVPHHKRINTPVWGFDPETELKDRENKHSEFMEREWKEKYENLEEIESLKHRMTYKLSLCEGAKRISKQVELDEKFRKTKKEFSKIANQKEIKSLEKWDYLRHILNSELKSTSLSYSICEVKEIFSMNDEEADPFYSISIENLPAQHEIITEMVNSFLETEKYFKISVLQGLKKSECLNLLSSEDQSEEIKLDHLTLMISNFTKTNYKCRDICLLYKRLIREVQIDRTKKLGALTRDKLENLLCGNNMNLNTYRKEESKEKMGREDVLENSCTGVEYYHKGIRQ